MRRHSWRRPAFWAYATIVAWSALFILGACTTWRGPMTDEEAVDHAIWCQQQGLVVSIWRDSTGRVVKVSCSV